MSLFHHVEGSLVLEIGSHTFEAEEIIRFASKFDPQPFHLDETAAKNSLFGDLCASGWHTLSVWMRLNVVNGRKLLASKSGYSGPSPQIGASPGVKNIKWFKPVFAGDTITYRTTIYGKRLLRSKPGWGCFKKHIEGFNQNGDIVLEFDGVMFLKTE